MRTARHRAALVLGLAASLAGCGRSPHLAGGPIELGGSPRYVAFERRVATATRDPAWELCYEFDPPGGSLSAGAIDAVLQTISGERYRFVDVELDRRGEAVVCRVGRLERIGPGRSPATGDSFAIAGVELASGVRLRLRGLRGGPRDR